jgi:hypothetical protein
MDRNLFFSRSARLPSAAVCGYFFMVRCVHASKRHNGDLCQPSQVTTRLQCFVFQLSVECWNLQNILQVAVPESSI